MNYEQVEAMRQVSVSGAGIDAGPAVSLKNPDKKLLLDALRSNGGGVPEMSYSEASKARLFKAGLIQWKPNQAKSRNQTLLLTLTQTGKASAQELAAAVG